MKKKILIILPVFVVIACALIIGISINKSNQKKQNYAILVLKEVINSGEVYLHNKPLETNVDLDYLIENGYLEEAFAKKIKNPSLVKIYRYKEYFYAFKGESEGLPEVSFLEIGNYTVAHNIEKGNFYIKK